MNILATIKAQREKFDQKVDAAIAERDAFLAAIGDAAGQPQTTNRRSNRRPMSAAQRKKLSDSKKKYWAQKKAAKK